MSDEYEQHLTGEAREEYKRRIAEVQRRIAAKDVNRFWVRMLADKVGRKEFWSLLEQSDALRFEFKYSPNGSISMDVTMAALGKARFMHSVYRAVFPLATDQIVLMHKENDPDFQPEPKDQPNAQSEEV